MKDEFEAVRQEPDPIRRGQRATELITTYQQRATELARLRKAAIEEAYRERDMSYTEIAAALGITKGRITQIKKSAADVQRVFFGVGPVSIGIPYRYQVTDRERPLIAAEDAETGEQLEALLTALAFTVDRYQIGPETGVARDGDGVVVCGPKSAPIGAALLAEDPVATLVKDDGRWWFEHRESGQRFGSPADEPDPENADIAYIARHRYEDRVIVHIAGIHAIGSLGVAHYLTGGLAELFRQVGDVSFSAAVRGSYEGLEITKSELIGGPYVW
ncbi:sigma factor-like helix-turn-helix DNA-binding protein [Saccharopolyspora sp. NPDC003752]